MRPLRLLTAAAAGCSVLLLACSPALNWREVRPAGTPVVALFPCKPDQGVRRVPLGGSELEMTMLGCEADGAIFTLAYVELNSAQGVDAILTAWKTATLASMQGRVIDEQVFVHNKTHFARPARRLRATGTRLDGTSVAVQAAWFEVGKVVYQMAVYTDVDQPEIAETYLDGLRFD